MSPPASLVLGPLLRYVDQTSAAIWVEVARPGRVEVSMAGRAWSAPTFGVHGHHYALVECTDLEPASVFAYEVRIEDDRGTHHVWPRREDGSEDERGGEPGDERGDGLALPPSTVATWDPDKPLRLVFGSCRTSVSHDRAGTMTHGVDALRAYALAHAGVTDCEEDLDRADLVLFLGDQVYADETSEAMQEFIASRRDIDEPPGEELADYEEYAYLYRLAWSDPANRWLLSTLPSAMIFDDHDVRDDWNTSEQWHAEMRTTSWWHDRIVAALASYWVYQHLGNLSPAERAEDEIYRQVLDHAESGATDELDLSETLDAFADRVDKHPETYRWSFAREVGNSRLVVVDSRAARVLTEDQRSMLDDVEMKWLDDQVRGDCDHLLIGTSLPFMLPEGLHHAEAFSEALAGGAWGPKAARVGEFLRQTLDLEHWGAFHDSFEQVAHMVLSVVAGERGERPRTITFLSGDVHHSYVSQVRGLPGPTKVLQAVCSPIRNPLPRAARFATATASYGIAGPIGLLAARSAHVPEPPLRWKRVRGPWFDNNIATLAVTEDGLQMWWSRGDVQDGDYDRPVLSRVASVDVTRDPAVRAGGRRLGPFRRKR